MRVVSLSCKATFTFSHRRLSSRIFQYTGDDVVVSGSSVSSRKRMVRSVLRSRASLTMATSGVRATPCDDRRNSPKEPCKVMEGIKSPVFMCTSRRLMPSTSICLRKRGSNWMCTRNCSAESNVSCFGERTSTPLMCRRSGKPSRTLSMLICMSPCLETAAVTLSTTKFWMAGT